MKILFTKLSDSECVIDTLRSLSYVGSVQLARLWLTCSTPVALSSQVRCGLSIWIQASQKGREYRIPFPFHVMGESLRFHPLTSKPRLNAYSIYIYLLHTPPYSTLSVVVGFNVSNVIRIGYATFFDLYGSVAVNLDYFKRSCVRICTIFKISRHL